MSLSSLVRVFLSLFLALTILTSTVVAALAVQNTPTASPAAAPADDGSTLIFNPVADAYVVQNTPNSNYGDQATLITDQELMSVSYMQFDVAGIESRVQRATLRLYVTNQTQSAPALWMAPAFPLDELGVTWNNRPALDSVVQVKQDEVAPEGEWLEYDVSAVVSQDGTYVFALVPSSTDGVDVVSREGDERRPELVIEMGNGRQESGQATVPDEEPILLAAGDIATCGEGAEKTAQILDDETGTVAALGDNAYNGRYR